MDGVLLVLLGLFPYKQKRLPPLGCSRLTEGGEQRGDQSLDRSSRSSLQTTRQSPPLAYATAPPPATRASVAPLAPSVELFPSAFHFKRSFAERKALGQQLLEQPPPSKEPNCFCAKRLGLDAHLSQPHPAPAPASVSSKGEQPLYALIPRKNKPPLRSLLGLLISSVDLFR